MNKIILVSLTALLVGCSTTQYRVSTPYEVSLIPNDCFNKKEITNWLENQIKFAEQQPKLYNENIKALKFKLWEIRTVCPR